MIVSIGEFWPENANLGIFLGTFSAKLEHFTHGGVAVDVGIAALDVGIFLGIELRNGVVGLHKLGFCFADTCALGAIFDISLGCALESGFHQDLFDDILNLLHRWDTTLDIFLGNFHYFIGNMNRTIITEFPCSRTSLCNSFSNFLLFEADNLTVALSD